MTRECSQAHRFTVKISGSQILLHDGSPGELVEVPNAKAAPGKTKSESL